MSAKFQADWCNICWKISKNVLHKKRCKKANFSKFFGSAWTPYPGSGDKLQPTDVFYASWCIVSQKTKPLTHTGVWKLCNKRAFWLLQIHRSTARLYQGETVYKPRSSYQCSIPYTYVCAKSSGQFWVRSDCRVTNPNNLCFFCTLRESSKDVVNVTCLSQRTCYSEPNSFSGLVGWYQLREWIWTRSDHRSDFDQLETSISWFWRKVSPRRKLGKWA